MAESKSILFVCGEPSGADYVHDILSELRASHPKCRLVAVGDTRRPVEGVEYIGDYSVFAHFAFVSVLLHYLSIRAAFKRIEKWCADKQPDLIVLVDSPGLNLRLAPVVRRYCDKLYYFISPHIWLWRYERVEIIRKFVDTMHPVLPWEVDIYRKEKIPVMQVQHPKLAKITSHEALPDSDFQEFLRETSDVVGLLPGSRRSEVNTFLPLLTQTALQLLERNCRLRFVVPVRAGAMGQRQIAYLRDKLGQTVHIVEDDFYTAIKNCDFALCASGTASLEVALMNVPMVVYYKLGGIDTLLARFFIKPKFVSLVNILFNSPVVAECLGDAANPDTLSAELDLLFHRRGRYHIQLEKFEQLQSLLSVKETMSGAIGRYLDWESDDDGGEATYIAPER